MGYSHEDISHWVSRQVSHPASTGCLEMAFSIGVSIQEGKSGDQAGREISWVSQQRSVWGPRL